MPNIKPISDLRNYNKVLRDISAGEPVFLTKNGRGKFAVIDISEYEKLKVSQELMSQITQGEQSGKEKGWMSNSQAEEELGINNDKKQISDKPKRYIVWSKNKIDLNDSWQKKWYVKQVLTYGRTEDVSLLDWKEIEIMLDDLDLTPDIKRLWENYFNVKRQSNFIRTSEEGS